MTPSNGVGGSDLRIVLGNMSNQLSFYLEYLHIQICNLIQNKLLYIANHLQSQPLLNPLRTTDPVL